MTDKLIQIPDTIWFYNPDDLTIWHYKPLRPHGYKTVFNVLNSYILRPTSDPLIFAFPTDFMDQYVRGILNIVAERLNIKVSYINIDADNLGISFPNEESICAFKMFGVKFE